VGVAYGFDITRVQDILLTIARKHPMVMTTPQPRALFSGYLEKSLKHKIFLLYRLNK